MRSNYRAILTVGAIALLAAVALLASPQDRSEAATANLASGYDVQIVPLHISGQYTTTTAGVARFKLPFAGQLIGVSASARASTGTSPTLTVDVKDDGVTALATPVSVTAGTVSEASITAGVIGDESVMTIDLTIGGTTPTWNDIVVLLTIVRT